MEHVTDRALEDVKADLASETKKYVQLHDEIDELKNRKARGDSGNFDDRLDRLERAATATFDRTCELRVEEKAALIREYKSGNIGGNPGDEEPGDGTVPVSKSWASGLLAQDRDWAPAAMKAIKNVARTSGFKAITSGTVGVPTVMSGYVPTANAPRRVTDLLTNRVSLTTNEFAYLKQTTRTNNAAVVADNATKPTSVFTLQQVEDRARVIAHLSEAIPVRLFDDEPELQRFLQVEMQEGILQALESEVMTGDGTGEHLTGILETSGVLSISFATDMFTTMRQARLELEQVYEQPTAWVLNPEDAMALDLAREETDGAFLIGDAATNVLGNLPRVISPLVPAGTGILGDWNQCRLYIRQGATLDADASGTLFEKNQVKVRCEMRAGFAVLRPLSFAIVELVDPTP